MEPALTASSGGDVSQQQSSMSPASPESPVSLGDAALDDLRRARRKIRIADLDWFEALYRVYLVAILFGGTGLWASSFIKDSKVAPSTLVDVFHYGPAAL